MRFYFLTLICIMALNACTQKPISTQREETESIAVLFTIPDKLIGEGFEPEELDEEAEAMGLTENPGFITNDKFKSYVLKGGDPSSIDHIFAHVLVKPERPSTEVGLIAVEFNSKEGFEERLNSLKKNIDPDNQGSSYIYKYPFIALVFTDSSLYEADRKRLEKYFLEEKGMEVLK